MVRFLLEHGASVTAVTKVTITVISSIATVITSQSVCLVVVIVALLVQKEIRSRGNVDLEKDGEN